MSDKYYVYRPLLELLGRSEGTSAHDGYNETLGYGAYTGGDVNLVGMTLAEIDALQTKMLRHPKNKLRSSALGMYQIVRTTLREIKKTLDLPESAKFDAEMQDCMGCYLLGVRGIDKWLAGRLSEDTMINNLAKEWASIPTTSGKGYYSGQNAAVKVGDVRDALYKVRDRHVSGQIPPSPSVPVSTTTKEVEPTETLGSILGRLFNWLFGRT